MKWFNRDSRGLFSKTKRVMSRAYGLLKGKKALNTEDIIKLRQILIDADCGRQVTDSAIEHIENVLSQGVSEDGELINALKDYLERQLIASDITLDNPLNVILVVGINGVGKTTTIAKLAKKYIAKGHKVALASGDTYRAAADEQLQHWAEEVGACFIQRPNTQDPAAVMFDACKEAERMGATILIADTAGRMHSNRGLMDQLTKVEKVLGKCVEGAPHKTWLVLDGSLGQSNLEQVRLFQASVSLNGLVMTKVDGSAKGGSLFAVAQEGLPICYIGSGENADDIAEFDASVFVEGMLSE